MKKISKVVFTCVSLFSVNQSYAALSPTAFLFFDGISNSGSTSQPVAGSGSWFSLQAGANTFVYVGITSFNGINLGVTQVASGSHAGAPDGTESPDIDSPWQFFGNTGMHQTTSPVTIVSDDNNGNVLLDFSGWGIVWNGGSVGAVNTDAWGGNPDGQAVLNCEFDCSMIDVVEAEFREGFTLDYTATIPPGDPSGRGGVRYQLHLESANYVPVPAAVWLFGSGLIALFGAARIRRS